jgi:hypothetical protein
MVHTEEGKGMKRTIQVRITRGEHQFVAECLDLPVVTQAPSLDELAENVREAITSDPTILAMMELNAVA